MTGVGTGGHITGVSEALKERFPSLQTFAVEPTKSAVISGGEPSPHRLQGIGAGFVPANLHTDTLDGAIQVSEEDAYAYEGVLLLTALARRAGSLDVGKITAAADSLSYGGPRGEVRMRDRHLDQRIYLAEADELQFDILTQL